MRKFLKQSGIHWAVRAQVARLGGFKGTRPLGAAEIDGFIQPLRETNLNEEANKKNDSNPVVTPTGGYTGDSSLLNGKPTFPPPGIAMIPVVEEPPPVLSDYFDLQSDTPHDWLGRIPDDIGAFDFTLLEDDLRRVLHGDDQWVGFTPKPRVTVETMFEGAAEYTSIYNEMEPYLLNVDESIHCQLVNWVRHRGIPDGMSIQNLILDGLENIITHGNRITRTLASEGYALVQGTDTHLTGDDTSCRIFWGETVQLDDCRTQGVAIGCLSFEAVDYGGTIPLSDHFQRQLDNEDRFEKNQRTLIALSAGLVSMTKGQERFLPSASRVLAMACDLRLHEWNAAQPYVNSTGADFSNNGKMVHSLRHDVVNPHHDRDYRAMALFLCGFFQEENVVVRVFDILKSLCGETVLQINVFGEFSESTEHIFLDVLAYSGHMRWLRSSGETTPAVARDWLIALGDFASIYPWQTIEATLDRDRTEVSKSTFLACRQCHRKEKAPLAPTTFYQSYKLTPNWSKAMVIESKRTGGYPSADPIKFGVVNEEFPISDRDWRGSVPVVSETLNFISKARSPFSYESIIESARAGDQLISKVGSLRDACRSSQEHFMRQQAELVRNAREHLSESPELTEDIAEIHHLGAIPRFRGQTPPVKRVRGLPHNPTETELMATKLWQYAVEGKMFICTTDGIPEGTRYLCSPSTTVAEKLPSRTLAVDKRLIWDGRRVNLHFPKQDYWFLETPLVKDLAQWYVELQSNFPGIPIDGTKRDIDAAFARCRLRPDASLMFATEFAIKVGGIEKGVVFFYMVLPFGFSGSPGIFGRVTQGVRWLHARFHPVNRIWDGLQSFISEIFVDDGMFLEARLGTRQQQSVEKWEWAATKLLGPTAISAKKLELEGNWDGDLLLLGFHVNLKSDSIALPDPKLVGAYNLIHLNVFNPGNYTVPLQTMQELRGCLNHWSNTNRLWRWLSEPINQLLGQTDTNLLWIRCGDPEKWLAFWHVILFLREVAEDEGSWRELFRG